MNSNHQLQVSRWLQIVAKHVSNFIKAFLLNFLILCDVVQRKCNATVSSVVTLAMKSSSQEINLKQTCATSNMNVSISSRMSSFVNGFPSIVDCSKRSNSAIFRFPSNFSFSPPSEEFRLSFRSFSRRVTMTLSVNLCKVAITAFWCRYVGVNLKRKS